MSNEQHLIDQLHDKLLASIYNDIIFNGSNTHLIELVRINVQIRIDSILIINQMHNAINLMVLDQITEDMKE